MSIPFAAISAAALACAPSLLADWFPHGKRCGHEFKIGSIRGEPGGSLSVNLNTGVWSDFAAGGSGGADLISLRAAMAYGGKQGAAARELAQSFGISVNGAGQYPAQEPKSGSKRIVETYDYPNATGELLFQVVRYEPKDFRQRRADGIWKMAGVEKVLYRLPRLIAAVAAGEAIFVVEGEKAAHVLESFGLTATCSPGGAGKWRPEYSPCLRGADVILLADNDEPGRKHVAQVAGYLRGVAGRVRILALPGLPEKADVADWVASGGTAAALAELVANAPDEAKPKPKPTPDPATEPPHEIPIPAVAALINEFNSRYMVVNEAGRAIIYEPAHDIALNRRYYERITFDDFRRLYLNRRVPIPYGDKIVHKPAADVWLEHPDRRQYIGGLVFDPSGRHTRSDVLNLWQGFAVTPRSGSWARMQNHILKIVCAGDQKLFEWLMGWMARLVQRPGEQGEVAIVMRGIEGCGKGTLAKALLHIIGQQHGMAISNAKHLTGAFNGHLRDTVLLFADEAFFAGDRAHVGVLKALITEPTLAIEAKYQNPVSMPNYVHLMMASNEDWVVPAGPEARRFLVLEVLPNRANDTAYFAAIWGEMKNGGYEAMLHDLLNYDLTFFNYRNAPKTAGLQEQKKLSLGTSEAWWMEVLHRGYVYRSKLGLEDHFGEWHDEMTTELLFASYTEFAKTKNERHPMDREAFGRFMVRMGAKSCRPRNAVVGERVADVKINDYGDTRRKAELIKKERATGYSLGSLAASREAFTRDTGLTMLWAGHDIPD